PTLFPYTTLFRSQDQSRQNEPLASAIIGSLGGLVVRLRIALPLGEKRQREPRLSGRHLARLGLGAAEKAHGLSNRSWRLAGGSLGGAAGSGNEIVLLEAFGGKALLGPRWRCGRGGLRRVGSVHERRCARLRRL